MSIITLSNKADTHNFTVPMRLQWSWVPAPWWRQLWWRLTPWWNPPPIVTEAVDYEKGVITARVARWSWTRFGWV